MCFGSSRDWGDMGGWIGFNLLTHNIKPAIAMFKKICISSKDLIPMVLGRPTLFSRCSLDDEKMGYILKTRVSKWSKMYKYVVATISVSHIETIQKKVANLERFGLSEDEVLTSFGRSPYLLTLSVDKVQRNMIFILGTMKLPAAIVLTYPFLLLLCNLEAVLKPRFLVAQKIDEMGLEPQIKGPNLMNALKKTEERFKKSYITCHEKTVADELMDVYTNAKCTKRLAESSKKRLYKGFPF